MGSNEIQKESFFDAFLIIILMFLGLFLLSFFESFDLRYFDDFLVQLLGQCF